ncbi:TonB family protein [Telluribacter sp. SYSU D00476]|uniref:TonB family protein n=1 Tax=Telluribacter sp. SYSU D00476 TaxID=2811430 RepID=UPI001FF1EB4E|nr:TonB family protein [Telluribacter sp. SYSU D00476]
MEALRYLGEVSLYWLLLYVCYWLLLRKHTFFGWNRAYLLGALLASFALPLLQYPEAAPVAPQAMYVVDAVPAVVIRPETSVVSTSASPDWSQPDWTQWVWLVYALGVVGMSIRLYRYLRQLFRFIRQGETIEMEGYTLVLMNDDKRSGGRRPGAPVGSFSFLKWVVISRNDYEHHFDTILSHELVHVQQRHSLDILLVELLRALFWFNPVLILYKRSLQQVHEYLADQQATNRDRYASFLVAYSLNTPVAVLTNHFFNSSLLKDRIQMLYKNRDSRWSLGKYLTILPLIGLVLMLSAAHERLALIPEESVTSILFPTVVPDKPGPVSVPQGGSLPEATPLPAPVQEEKTTVTGTVLNAQTNQPLPGANVVVTGSTAGTTTTGPDGKFELKEVPLNSSLAVSHVGYETLKVNVTKKNQVLRIALKRQEQPLEEITIVTYPIAQIKASSADTSALPTRDGEVYRLVEQMPEFPGGIKEMYMYLAKKIRYPTEARDKRIQGKVFISFVVSERGSIREPRITKGLGAGIDEEALRVVLNMPAWKPAMQNGQPVSVVYTLPIQFTIEEDDVKENKEKRQGSATGFLNYKLDDAVDFALPTRLPDNIPIGLSPIHTSRSSSTIIIESENLKKE